MVVDPAREFFNPYLAYANNPIIHVDPNGEDSWYIFNSVGWIGGLIWGAGESIKNTYVFDDYGIVMARSHTLLRGDEDGQGAIGLAGGFDLGIGRNNERSYLNALNQLELSVSGKLVLGGTFTELTRIIHLDKKWFQKHVRFKVAVWANLKSWWLYCLSTHFMS
ncbi:MAG: hypothetical protein ACJA2S_003218, partial [Cyclobacteriaceae bacterium]